MFDKELNKAAEGNLKIQDLVSTLVESVDEDINVIKRIWEEKRNAQETMITLWLKTSDLAYKFKKIFDTQKEMGQ